MARGILSGLIWGTIVAGVGAGGLSLAYPDFKPSGVEVASGDQQTDDMSADNSDDAPADENPAPAMDGDADGSDGMAAEDDTAEAETSDTDTELPKETGSEETGGEAAEEMADQPEPEATDADEPTTETSEDTATEPAPEPEATDADEQPAETETAEAEATDPTPETDEAEAPSVADEIIAALPKPDGTVGNLAPNVTTDRLPSVETDDVAEEEGPSAVAPPPLERFAAEVEFDDSKPLMSIVLIDDGTTDLGFDALESFPYPLTFAVDASASSAKERMESYRERGLEVMAMVSMPQGATASDAEVAMTGYFAAVPEAVAILEDPGASLQTNRGLSDQVVEILKSSGHGIVFQASGLNTAQKLSLKEGVASARVFRDFDGSDQKANVIRRFLDQAAFKANQEGAVVMLGRLRAETISALLIWGLADRASRVALVPVSTVLQNAVGGGE